MYAFYFLCHHRVTRAQTDTRIVADTLQEAIAAVQKQFDKTHVIGECRHISILQS